MVLPESFHFFLILAFFDLELLIELIVLLRGILDVGLLNLLVGIQRDFVLLLKIVYLLTIDYLQLLLL